MGGSRWLGCCLKWALSRRHEVVVKLLQAWGNVDPNSSMEKGETSLWLAARRGDQETVRLLLTCGDVDVNFSSARGSTPLLEAAERGHEEIVQLLLVHNGIEADPKDIPKQPRFRGRHLGDTRLSLGY